MRKFALAFLFVTTALSGANAQGVTADEILKKITPPTPPARTRSLTGAPADPAAKARTRAIQILEAGAPEAPAAAPGTPVAVPAAVVVKPELVEEFKQVKAELPKIDLRITFHFGSDRPTPEGLQQLHALGQALQKLPAGKFVLIGHTDAIGSDQANDLLSVRRARAVAAILAAQYQVPFAKLTATGMGERQLLAGLPPDHEQNRRVEIVNLGE